MQDAESAVSVQHVCCLLQESLSFCMMEMIKKDAEAMKAQLGEESKVRVILGAFPEEEMESLDLVVMSPGVPTDLSVVLAMKEKGIPVWGEIELAYVCGKGDVLGITGTKWENDNNLSFRRDYEKCP